ncbi:TPA: AAA family ATPase [Streptococcus pyogenes]|nr:AAA family ATPase [Streptococcus pyogenes]
MFKIPENKPQVPKDTPRNFFIYGETMSGKSFLANEFPNPFIINTDGNSQANSVPSYQLYNHKDKNGKITKSVTEQLGEIILAFQTQKHDYETLVIDVIDDVVDMISFAIQNANGVDSLGDIPFGKGYAMQKDFLKQMASDLKQLPMNVIYISRVDEKFDDKGNVSKVEPSLHKKHFNIFNGNYDLMILTEKIGRNYTREVSRKRKNYYSEQVDDKNILKILQTIDGAVINGSDPELKKISKTEVTTEANTTEKEIF